MSGWGEASFQVQLRTTMASINKTADLSGVVDDNSHVWALCLSLLWMFRELYFLSLTDDVFGALSQFPIKTKLGDLSLTVMLFLNK